MQSQSVDVNMRDHVFTYGRNLGIVVCTWQLNVVMSTSSSIGKLEEIRDEIHLCMRVVYSAELKFAGM